MVPRMAGLVRKGQEKLLWCYLVLLTLVASAHLLGFFFRNHTFAKYVISPDKYSSRDKTWVRQGLGGSRNNSAGPSHHRPSLKDSRLEQMAEE